MGLRYGPAFLAFACLVPPPFSDYLQSGLQYTTSRATRWLYLQLTNSTGDNYSLPQQFHGTSLGAKGSSHPRLGLQVLPPWNEQKKACTIGYLHGGVGLRYGPAFLAFACLVPPPSVTTCKVAYNTQPAGRLDGYTSKSSTLLETTTHCLSNSTVRI